MNNKKQSDDDFFEEDFNEDFDFGDEKFDQTPDSPKGPKPSLKKPLLALLMVLVVGGFGYYGYQFYKKQPKTQPTVAVKKPVQQPVKLVETPKTPLPKPTVQKETAQPISNSNTTEIKQTPAVNPENIKPEELEKFLSADNEPVTKTEKTDTLQELQQDLFTPHPKAITKETKTGELVEPKEQAPIPVTGTAANTTSLEMQQIKEATETLTKLNQQLSAQMEKNLSQIKNFDSYTREISQTIAKLNSEISAMDNRILALTNTTNSLSKDIKSIRGEIGKTAQPMVFGEDMLDVTTAPVPVPGKRGIAPPNILIEEPEYSVHAVIPGRAWLKSTKGQIVTVTEGDNLGNYGKIIVIDATNGVVLSSSGIAFR